MGGIILFAPKVAPDIIIRKLFLSKTLKRQIYPLQNNLF